MTQAISNNRIMEELQTIKQDLRIIKTRVLEEMGYLTKSDEEIVRNSIRELREGKTKNLEQLKKELKIKK